MSASFSHPPEQHLIQEMYLAHHDWLQHWLSNRIRYPFNAADLVQDTFLKLLQSNQKILAIQEPRAYLVNMAKNLLIDKQRRYRLEKTYLEGLRQQYENEAGWVLSTEQLEQTIDLLEFLTLALQGTSVTVRKAFLMYYFEGYNQSEIAERIGKSLRATQAYLAECLHLCYCAKQKYPTQLEV